MPGAAKILVSLFSGALRFFASHADKFSETTSQLMQYTRWFLYRDKGGIASRLSARLGLGESQFCPPRGILRIVVTFFTNVNTRFSCV